MKIEELWWAAGFFDGEGNSGYEDKSKKLYVQIGQKNTNLEVLERFKSAVGNIGVVRVYKDTYSTTGKKGMYQVSSMEALNVLSLILPYLSSAKREQASSAILKFTAYRERMVTHCRRGHKRTSENTHLNIRGDKVCRECEQINNKKCRKKRNISIVA